MVQRFMMVFVLFAAGYAQAQQPAQIDGFQDQQAIITGEQQTYRVEPAKIYLEEALTVGAGATEIGFALDYTTARHEFGAETGSLSLRSNHCQTAAVGMAHGIFEDLDVVAGLFMCRETNYNDSRERGGGIGDLSVVMKWMFLNTEDDRFTLSAAAGAIIPSGTRPDESRLAPGGGFWMMQQSLLMSAVVGNFSFTANGGAFIPVRGAAEEPTRVFARAAAGWQVTSILQPVLEVHHDFAADAEMSSTSLAAGIMVALPANFRFDAGLQYVVAGKNTPQSNNVMLRLVHGF